MVIFGKIEIFDHVLKWMTYNVYTGSYISIFELIIIINFFQGNSNEFF